MNIRRLTTLLTAATLTVITYVWAATAAFAAPAPRPLPGDDTGRLPDPEPSATSDHASSWPMLLTVAVAIVFVAVIAAYAVRRHTSRLASAH